MTKEEKKAIIEILDGLKRFHEKEKEQQEAVWTDKDWSGRSVAGYMACPCCNVMIPTDSARRIRLPYMRHCPNCGARMKGANNDR